jgi:hypothetical protein
VIDAGEVLMVSTTLHVAAPFEGGFSNFAFDIQFEGVVNSTAYNVTINAYDQTVGTNVQVAIVEDGLSTGFDTSYTFTGLTGNHTFTVPSADVNGNPFEEWSTGETNTTITVSSAENCTAYYQAVPPSTYTVSFAETGLPLGSTWWVDINNNNQSSSSSVINFYLPNGIYSYVTGASNWAAAPSGGSVIVSGANNNSQVTFTIVPEFPSLTILLLYMMAMLLAAIVFRKRKGPSRDCKDHIMCR